MNNMRMPQRDVRGCVFKRRRELRCTKDSRSLDEKRCNTLTISAVLRGVQANIGRAAEKFEQRRPVLSQIQHDGSHQTASQPTMACLTRECEHHWHSATGMLASLPDHCLQLVSRFEGRTAPLTMLREMTTPEFASKIF